MKVPFADLNLQYQNLKPEIDAAIASVIQENAFIGGGSNRFVVDLEKQFAEYIGTTYGIGCANGTDAIELILTSQNYDANAEVLVPAISWYSSAEAVITCGQKVKFVDVNDDFTIDTDKIEASITPNTKAIVVVHLYGNAANMTAIMEIAQRHNLFVVEDCAQSHGATHNGQNVGTFGDAASFSFYPGKNLGAYGDAGMILTNREDVSKYTYRARNHGQEQKHNHFFSGRNSRLDGIQAAIVSAKLPSLNSWNELRLYWAKRYVAELGDIDGLALPRVFEDDSQVFHLFVVRTSKRDELKNYLKEKEVATAIHYPQPLHVLPPFSDENNDTDFPNSLQITKEILSLPIFPEMTEEHFNAVCEAIKGFTF
jgi:dTDP-4-amino-4,6-dideoxygalactose transaminase